MTCSLAKFNFALWCSVASTNRIHVLVVPVSAVIYQLQTPLSAQSYLRRSWIVRRVPWPEQAMLSNRCLGKNDIPMSDPTFHSFIFIDGCIHGILGACSIFYSYLLTLYNGDHIEHFVKGSVELNQLTEYIHLARWFCSEMYNMDTFSLRMSKSF